MSDEPIRSWRAAARHANVPITSLRDAVQRGDVPPPTSADDGSTVWDVVALDALREARSAIAIDDPIAAMAVDDAIAGSAIDDASEIEYASSTSVELPDFLQAIGSARPSDENAESDVEPIAPEIAQPPLGAVPMTGWLATVAEVQAEQACVVELQREIAELRTQLAAANATSASWRDWYRLTRVKAIADAIAIEAAALGADAQAAQAAAYAAAQAVGGLPDDQLVRDDVAVPYAQQVGHGVGAAWAAALRASAGVGVGGEARSELDRARDRQARMRRRR